eukprot:SAG22_NODE_7278_length_755_cov_1.195122_1_plen_72_part_01
MRYPLLPAEHVSPSAQDDEDLPEAAGGAGAGGISAKTATQVHAAQDSLFSLPRARARSLSLSLSLSLSVSDT